MSTCALPDIYTLGLGPVAPGKCIYIRQSTHAYCYMYCTYTVNVMSLPFLPVLSAYYTQYAISDVRLMLIANKRDIKGKRQVTTHQGKQVQYQILYS